jgi:hypothetical protein
MRNLPRRDYISPFKMPEKLFWKNGRLKWEHERVEESNIWKEHAWD